MWSSRRAVGVTVLMVVATVAPALAKPIEISSLGHAPLIGQSTSPGELKDNISTHETVLRRAAMKLGLTPEQYRRFRLAAGSSTQNWVTIPRHLDAMSWQERGRVYVLHDVVIPANQKGIEVDLHDGDKEIALFMPARCGNLSLIRRSTPHVAAARIRNFPVPHPAPPVAADVPPPVALVPPAGTDTVAAAPPVAIVPPPAPATPIVAPVTPHAVGLLPVLGLIPFLFSGGGHSSIANIIAPVNGGGGSVIPPPPCPSGTGP